MIMNVEEMPDADAKRLVDSHPVWHSRWRAALSASPPKVFLLTPSNLEVLGVANSEVPAGFETDGDSPSTRAKD